MLACDVDILSMVHFRVAKEEEVAAVGAAWILCFHIYFEGTIDRRLLIKFH